MSRILFLQHNEKIRKFQNRPPTPSGGKNGDFRKWSNTLFYDKHHLPNLNFLTLLIVSEILLQTRKVNVLRHHIYMTTYYNNNAHLPQEVKYNNSKLRLHNFIINAIFRQVGCKLWYFEILFDFTKNCYF